MTATTALTAQNTQCVEDIHYVPPEFVGKLIDVSIGDIGVDVVKTGNSLILHFWLGEEEIIDTIILILIVY